MNFLYPQALNLLTSIAGAILSLAIGQSVGVSLSSLEMANPDKLKFLGIIPLGVQMVLD